MLKDDSPALLRIVVRAPYTTLSGKHTVGATRAGVTSSTDINELNTTTVFGLLEKLPFQRELSRTGPLFFAGHPQL